MHAHPSCIGFECGNCVRGCTCCKLLMSVWYRVMSSRSVTFARVNWVSVSTIGYEAGQCFDQGRHRKQVKTMALQHDYIEAKD